MWYKTLSWGKIHACPEWFYLLFHLQYFTSVFSPILGLLSPWTLTRFSGGLGIVRFTVGLDYPKGLFQPKWFHDFYDSVLYTEYTYLVFSSARYANQKVKESTQFCLAVTSFPFPQSQQWLYLSHIQWQNSHSLHLVRTSRTPLSLRRLTRKKILLDQPQSYKVSAKQVLLN